MGDDGYPNGTRELLRQLHDRLVSLDNKNDTAHAALTTKVDGLVTDVGDVKARISRAEGELSDLKAHRAETTAQLKELRKGQEDLAKDQAVASALTKRQKLGVAGISAGSAGIILALIEIIKHLLGIGVG